MTQDSVITKADLLKTHKVGTWDITGQDLLETNAQRRNTANLFRPEQIKANALEEMYKIHPSAAIMGAIGGKITGGATGLAASTINAITEAAQKATKTTARGSTGGYRR